MNGTYNLSRQLDGVIDEVRPYARLDWVDNSTQSLFERQPDDLEHRLLRDLSYENIFPVSSGQTVQQTSQDTERKLMETVSTRSILTRLDDALYMKRVDKEVQQRKADEAKEKERLQNDRLRRELNKGTSFVNRIVNRNKKE